MRSCERIEQHMDHFEDDVGSCDLDATELKTNNPEEKTIDLDSMISEADSDFSAELDGNLSSTLIVLPAETQ